MGDNLILITILASVIISLITAGILIFFFFVLARKNKLVRNAVLEMSGMYSHLRGIQEFYVKLVEQKQSIQDLISSSVAKNEQEVMHALERKYKELDDIALEYVKQMDHYESVLQSLGKKS